jgi:hypothetical protein
MHAQIQALSTMKEGRQRYFFFRLFHAARRACMHLRPCTHPGTPGSNIMSGGELGLLVLPTCKSYAIKHETSHLPLYLVVQYSRLRLRLSLCLLPLCLLPAPMCMPSHISCRCISSYSTPASASRCACCRCACSPRRCPCRATRFSSTELPSPRPWRYFPGE